MSSSLRCRLGLHDWVAIGRRTDKVRVFSDLDVTEEHVYGIDRCRRCDRLREVELHYPPLTAYGDARNRRYPVRMGPPPRYVPPMDRSVDIPAPGPSNLVVRTPNPLPAPASVSGQLRWKRREKIASYVIIAAFLCAAISAWLLWRY